MRFIPRDLSSAEITYSNVGGSERYHIYIPSEKIGISYVCRTKYSGANQTVEYSVCSDAPVRQMPDDVLATGAVAEKAFYHVAELYHSWKADQRAARDEQERERRAQLRNKLSQYMDL